MMIYPWQIFYNQSVKYERNKIKGAVGYNKNWDKNKWKKIIKKNEQKYHKNNIIMKNEAAVK